jgi:hypothetical protein
VNGLRYVAILSPATLIQMGRFAPIGELLATYAWAPRPDAVLAAALLRAIKPGTVITAWIASSGLLIQWVGQTTIGSPSLHPDL